MSARTSPAIFVTGATGFIGRTVLDRLLSTGTHRITCLVRTPNAAATRRPGREAPESVVGDLEAPATYAQALAATDIVLHMAAATGSASAAEMRRINVDGTQQLVDACKRAGVRQFVLMSSIAAAGNDVVDYPYALTKIEAEKAVIDSGLRYAIVRPTIVLGADGGNFHALRKIACLPVIPVFGGGTARVQPIDVGDVARAVEIVVDRYAGSDSTIDLGGPEVLTFADFLLRIRRACGRGGAPLLPVPARPMRLLLTLASGLLGSALPIRAGQLAAFVNDGVAEPNAVQEQLRPTMAGLDELLARIVHAS